MAGNKTPRVYWDACVFIALYKGDKPAQEIKDGLRYWTAKARAGEAHIVTSAITYAEVLRFHHQQKYPIFSAFMDRYVIRQAADVPVMKLCHEIRDYFAGHGFNLATADAIHVATAVATDCDELHTFDGISGKHAKNCLKLLPLNGQIPNTKMRICLPKAPPVVPKTTATPDQAQESMFDLLDAAATQEQKHDRPSSKEPKGGQGESDGAVTAGPGAGTPQVGGGLDGPGEASAPSAPPPGGVPEAPEQAKQPER